MTKPVAVYGGPYAHETDEITLESSKETPDYDSLISGWKTISQGALDYIESLKHPVDPKTGTFVTNVVVNYDKEDGTTPEVADFDRDRKTLGNGELVEPAPEGATNPENNAGEDTKVENQTEIDLDKL